MDQETALKNLTMENNEDTEIHTEEPRFHFVAHKSGMQKVDRAKLNTIILEASRGSRYYYKQIRKKQKNEEELGKIKEKIEKTHTDKQQIQGIQVVVDQKVKQLEKERDLSRTWVHVDMDMFFVACEIRDSPELKDKPVAVGTMGYLNTSNYVARQYGIITMMPGFIGKKLCPELIILPLNREKYRETSQRMKNVVVEYDPGFESESLDGAVVDLTDYLKQRAICKSEDIERVCYEMRMKINEATGITCSCGIGPNKMLAKLATEINKPNGQYYMRPDREEIMQFINKLPVRKIAGVGNVSEKMLNELGIKTCKDILDNLVDLYIGFSEVTFDFLLKAALGIGPHLHQVAERKSFSVRKTFDRVSETEVMEDIIREIANDLSRGLQNMKKKTKHLTLMVKSIDFDEQSKGSFLDKFTNDEAEIVNIGINFLKKLLPLEPLRSMAICAGNLSDEESLHSLDNLFKRMGSRTDVLDCLKEDTSFEYEAVTSVSIDDKSQFGTIAREDIVVKEEDSKFSMITESTTDGLSVHPTENIISRKFSLIQQESKKEEIRCPVCLMSFESIVNNAKINKHLDKCLQASIEDKPVVMKGQHQNEHGILESQRSKKRKPKDEQNSLPNELKKTKKTVERSSSMKLENFFSKK